LKAKSAERISPIRTLIEIKKIVQKGRRAQIKHWVAFSKDLAIAQLHHMIFVLMKSAYFLNLSYRFFFSEQFFKMKKILKIKN
jgi:hypothetical protein